MDETLGATGSANRPAEPVDPDTGEALGNLPLAPRRLALINAAGAVEEAED